MKKFQEFLDTRNKTTRTHYKKAFQLFMKYGEEVLGERLTGLDLIHKIAEDRRKDIEDRSRPEITILKGFWNWLRKTVKTKNGVGYAKKSCHVYLSGLISFLKYYDLPVNRDRLNLPRANRKKINRKKSVRRQEVKALVDHALSNRDKALILCQWQSGMGIGDLLSLNVGDVLVDDPVRGSLDDPPLLIELARKKTGVNYRTFFGRDACVALKRYLEERERIQGKLEESDPLFTTRKGKKTRLKKPATSMLFRRLALRSGLVTEKELEEADFNPLRSHSLRSGFSSVLKEEGANESVINGWQGHRVSYDSAYHNFTDKQLRDLYRKYEPVLSISQTSMPRKDEVLEVVKEEFGVSGVERIKPKLEKLTRKINTHEKEIKKIKKHLEEYYEWIEKEREKDVVRRAEELLKRMSKGEREELLGKNGWIPDKGEDNE